MSVVGPLILAGWSGIELGLVSASPTAAVGISLLAAHLLPFSRSARFEHVRRPVRWREMSILLPRHVIDRSMRC